MGDGQHFSLKLLSSDKPKVIDASHLFKPPHRATRPDHIVIILRGLPGSLFWLCSDVHPFASFFTRV